MGKNFRQHFNLLLTVLQSIWQKEAIQHPCEFPPEFGCHGLLREPSDVMWAVPLSLNVLLRVFFLPPPTHLSSVWGVKGEGAFSNSRVTEGDSLLVETFGDVLFYKTLHWHRNVLDCFASILTNRIIHFYHNLRFKMWYRYCQTSILKGNVDILKHRQDLPPNSDLPSLTSIGWSQNTTQLLQLQHPGVVWCASLLRFNQKHLCSYRRDNAAVKRVHSLGASQVSFQHCDAADFHQRCV